MDKMTCGAAHLCDMPWTTECGNPAVAAYIDEVSGNILYRCQQHQLRLENGPQAFKETIRQITLEEALTREVMTD